MGDKITLSMPPTGWGSYIVTAYLAAAQMADPIVIQLFDGETYGEQHTYNAVDESNFMESGCRLQSELREVLGIGIPSPGSSLLYLPL